MPRKTLRELAESTTNSCGVPQTTNVKENDVPFSQPSWLCMYFLLTKAMMEAGEYQSLCKKMIRTSRGKYMVSSISNSQSGWLIIMSFVFSIQSSLINHQQDCWGESHWLLLQGGHHHHIEQIQRMDFIKEHKLKPEEVSTHYSTWSNIASRISLLHASWWM